MNGLLVLAGHNTIAAIVLALLVYAVTRVWRHPAVAHVLWLLVLLKLVSPPIMRFEWRALEVFGATTPAGPVLAESPRSEGPGLNQRVGLMDRPTTPATDAPLAAYTPEQTFAAAAGRWWDRCRPVLLGLWLVGTAGCVLLTVSRIVRFERLLRNTLPASEKVQRLAGGLAGRLGLRRTPAVCYAESVEVPLLWCAGGSPRIVLPLRLVNHLDEHRLELILAHELAHLRRRDHWVRLAELLIATVYWWNPLMWIARRRLHQAEDLCCDAWVRWLFPGCAGRYAEVVFQTAELVSAPRIGARLLPASQFLHSLSLKARIQMILESHFAPYASTRSTLVIAALALLVLPSFVQGTTTEVRAAAPSEVAATPADKPQLALQGEFPHRVKFEQGATRFAEGDSIVITEIRGTAETFVPGNIYWIKGTYTLASRDKATLSAYTTAMDAANARSQSMKVQSVTIDRGEGTFTLFLPMTCRGWPHVSFYPAGGGEGFGGNYVGTGESVLKRWWGSKEK